MHFSKKNNKVELHVHFDGAFRASTLFELAQQKNKDSIPVTAEEFKESLRVTSPCTLREFLTKFAIFLPLVNNDKSAIWRTAYEFIEDCDAVGICYVEARFCPQLLAGPDITADEVCKTVLEAFETAGAKFGVTGRIILTTIRECKGMANEVLELAIKYKSLGVVGVDMAGDEQHSVEQGGSDEEVLNLFNKAKELGIHRTVHAGENGPADFIGEAVHTLHAERIGHGYSVLADTELYEKTKKLNIHFETCPYSSYLTGGVCCNDWTEHVISQFAKDKVNYSINTDDPLVTGTTLADEYSVCINKIQIDPCEVVRCIFNAAKSSFLPESQKLELLNHLRECYNAH